MKYSKTYLLLFVFTGVICSCKKNNIESRSLASVKIVNAIAGGETIKIGSRTTTVTANSNDNFGLVPGTTPLYIWPTSDSLSPYYNNSITTSEQEIYTLFLGGTPAAVDAVLIKETIPTRTDSTIGVRFINLSPGSPEVKVTLSTSTGISEFGNVAYKSYTDFKGYPAGVAVTSYNFQVRNATTNALITSMNITGTTNTTGIPRWQNITLVLRGIVGGSPAPGLTRVNHF